MRIIQYFLIGLFLSLCTIPAFASCPVGFTDITSQYLSNGGDVSMGTVCENIVPFDFGFGLEKGMFFWDGGVWDNFGTANGYDLAILRSVGYLFPYVNEGTQMGAFRWDGVDFIIYDGDSFLMPYFGKVSFSGGGSISTPVALFNIDGIKDNIFATLLAIVGVLLGLVSLKYAWSCFSNIFKDGSGSNAGRVSSDDVTYERVGQSNFYRQTHWVDGVDVAHSYDKGGVVGSSYNVGDTGHRGGYDYDEVTGKPV